MDNENETKDSSVKLSDETLAKFAEVKTLVDDAEEAELVAVQDEKDKAERPMDVRRSDEGLTEEGEVVGLEEEEEKAEKEEEVKEEVSEAVEEEAEEEKVEGKEERPTELALPNRLIQAGYRNDMTDDDILALGDRAEAVLSKMADNTDKVSAILGERGRQVKVEEEKKPEPLKFGTEDEDLVGKETLGKIATSHAGLDERLVNLERADTKRQAEITDSTVDGFFDGKAEEYPEFGKAAALTDIELIKRQQIAAKAFDIRAGAQFYGRPIALPSALEQAFSIYETENVKQKERTKLVSKVKSRSGQLTIRPTKRKTEQKFSSGREKAMDNYRKEMERIGQTVPDDDED